MTGGRAPAKLGAVKTVQCSCGYTASGETADELLADVEAHIAAVHAPLEPVGGFGREEPTAPVGGETREE